MRKLRIIQVLNVRWFNATAWYGLFISRLLREQGHETLVLGLEGTDSFRKARAWGLEPLALPLNVSRPWEIARLFRELRALLRDFRPDVVNCHRGENFAIWCLLRKLEHFALVRTRGDRREPRGGLFNRLLYSRGTDALIATNSEIADFFVDRFGLDPAAVFTVLGGVDRSVFYPDRGARERLRAAWGCGPADFVVGLLGRLDPVKGHEILINALGLLKKKLGENFGFRLICIGAPSDLLAQDIERLCRKVDIQQRHIVTGWVENVREALGALDLGVLSSVYSEAIARAALEIIACDVPLLSSDIGVMPDVLPEAMLTPLADAKALAGALERCRREPAFLEELRAAGREALRGLDGASFLRNTLVAYQYALTKLPGFVSPAGS
jgi:glycosyltransferase involved in cell wall biosynthesis